MVYEPLDLLLDHLLGGQEHVFEDFNQLGLELSVRDPFAHLQDLHDRLLHGAAETLNFEIARLPF